MPEYNPNQQHTAERIALLDEGVIDSLIATDSPQAFYQATQRLPGSIRPLEAEALRNRIGERFPDNVARADKVQRETLYRIGLLAIIAHPVEDIVTAKSIERSLLGNYNLLTWFKLHRYNRRQIRSIIASFRIELDDDDDGLMA